ncbi:DUF4836 family protein, partial [Alistipes putredinis]|uniref:DUF4836 family protein n=1 Tax=Alistipes putredinis TaxID=28117 RepID=UPI00210C712B
AASLMALSLFDTLESTRRTERQGELVLNMTDKEKNAAEVLYKTIEGIAQMFAATMFLVGRVPTVVLGIKGFLPE